MNKYKTFEEIKEELGDKLEKYMYEANIELLTKIDRAIEYIGLNEEDLKIYDIYDVNGIELYKILKGSDKE